MRAGCFVKMGDQHKESERGQGEVEFSIDFSSFMSQSPYHMAHISRLVE